MPWNSGGSGPWGDPPNEPPNGPPGGPPKPGAPEEPGNAGRNGPKKPSNETVQGPWGTTSSGSGKSGRPNPGSRGGGPQGGGSGGGGPFGGGPFGGGPFNGGPFGGGEGNEIDRLIASLQRMIRGFLGGGRGGGGGGGGGWSRGRNLWLLVGVVILFWMGTGVYRVQPDEQGVVMRFGAYAYWTPPGLHWHLPWPIESVQTPSVTRINRTEIGFRSAGSDLAQSGRDTSGRDIRAESLMLTGDENIIDIDVAVFWRVSNAPDFLFNTADPATLVRAVAESSLREVIGRTPIQPALTQARAQIEADVFKQTQEILDRYKAGVEITQVQLQKVDPPDAVIESFRDVQRANTDAERLRNEADAYANDIVPRARGEAAKIMLDGQGTKAATVARATGEAQRFDSVLKAYQQAKEVTARRLYLDTMEDILAHSQPLVVDDRLKGLVPFLQLKAPDAKPGDTAPSGTVPAPPPLPGVTGGNASGGNAQ
jgi:modulator of FtsH protease HflK